MNLATAEPHTLPLALLPLQAQLGGVVQGSALRGARLPVNLISSPVNYANILIGSPITTSV